MIKYLVFLLLPFSCLFPAKIALTCLQKHPYSSCILYPEELIKKFQDLGHTIKLVPLGLRTNKNLDEYDLIVGIIPFHIKPSYQKKMIFYPFEPGVILKKNLSRRYLSGFHKVFTWNHDIYDGVQFHKGFDARCEEIHPEFIPFQDRKFVCLINSFLRGPARHKEALYIARKEIAEFYDANFPTELTLHGGRGWGKLKISIYQGNCPDKNSVLRNHRFNYCYENWDNKYHYISEKISDCFSNRCVPIYLGSSRVTDYIPENTFIDARQFSSIEEMHEYISTMSEETWLTYIKAIEEYLTSEKSKYFKKEYFIDELSKEMIKSLEEFGAT